MFLTPLQSPSLLGWLMVIRWLTMVVNSSLLKFSINLELILAGMISEICTLWYVLHYFLHTYMHILLQRPALASDQKSCFCDQVFGRWFLFSCIACTQIKIIMGSFGRFVSGGLNQNSKILKIIMNNIFKKLNFVNNIFLDYLK